MAFKSTSTLGSVSWFGVKPVQRGTYQDDSPGQVPPEDVAALPLVENNDFSCL